MKRIVPSSPYYGASELSVDQEDALLNGDFDVELGGEATDYTTEFTHYAYLTGTNVVPPVSTPAIGAAVLRVTDDGINFFAIFQGLASGRITADLYDAPEGINGNFVARVYDSEDLNDNDGDNSFEANLDLSGAQREDLLRDDFYLVVTSSSFPFGEIRGQFFQLSTCQSLNAPAPADDSADSRYFSTDDFTTKDPITFSDLQDPSPAANANSNGVYTNPILTTDATYSRISFSGLQSSSASSLVVSFLLFCLSFAVLLF